MTYVDIPIETNPEVDLETFLELAEAAFPGVEFSEAGMDWWIVYWWAHSKTDLAELVKTVGAEAFRAFGQKILGVPFTQAAPATASVTFTLTDTAGHMIPAGTQLEIVDGDERYGFATVDDLIVPAASSTGSTDVAATVAGEQANGVTGEAGMIDALSFVASVEFDDEPSSGADEQDPDDYAAELAERVKLFTERPVTAAECAIFAKRIPGIERATAIDNYDPADGSTDNEKMVTIWTIDSAGGDTSAPVKALLEAALEAVTEIGFIYHLEDPERTTVDVDYSVVPRAGYESVAIGACDAALAYYLDPANFGRVPGYDWRNSNKVYLNEIISLLDSLPSVDRVVEGSVKLGANGGARSAANLTMSGDVSLPEPGDFDGTLA